MEPRKLKRGLKDISPLFQGTLRSAEVHQEAPTQKELRIINVVSQDRKFGELFSRWLCAQDSFQSYRCSVVDFDWKGFKRACQKSTESQVPLTRSEMIFLNIEWQRIPYIEKVIPILDQWILVAKPEMQSLADIYKLIKASRSLHSNLEYFLLFEGDVSSKKRDLLFQRFSEMISRRLGVNVSLLGGVRQVGEHIEPTSLSLDPFFTKPSLESLSVEKMALAGLIQNTA